MEIINRTETVSLLEEKVDFVAPKGLDPSRFEVIVEYRRSDCTISGDYKVSFIYA